jgi:hypothetical protein
MRKLGHSQAMRDHVANQIVKAEPIKRVARSGRRVFLTDSPP